MKTINKKHSNLVWFLFVAILSFSLISAKCFNDTEAGTVFADTAKTSFLSKDSVAFLEKMQKANRELTSAVLPSVVTIDVVETRKIRDPFGLSNSPFHFFFGKPDGEDEEGTREYKAQGLGSGFIVRKKGNIYYALTNQHVIGNATDISVMLYGGKEIKAKLIGSDTRKDIALISFESTENIPIAKLGNSDEVQVGDLAFAIGSPMGYVSSVTQGMISAVGRHGGPNKGNVNDFIQTDAAINQGNSGGPLVNIYGEVIGINTWIASSSGGSQGLGFSIPINNVKKAIDDFINNGVLQYGWLGVQLVQVDKEFLASLKIDSTEGALASQVFLGSPADKAGIMPGDFIVELNGKPVKSVDNLVRDVGDLLAGETAVFKVLRNNKAITLNAKIEARDEKIVENSSKLWPGFTPIPITEEIIEKLKLNKGQKGVVIASILPKSPGIIMGLKQSDVIVSVCDKKISNIAEFYKELSVAPKEVWFDIIREGQTLSTVRFKKN
ncbi:MAG: Do family serine endopeptidase [Treponema sp.]